MSTVLGDTDRASKVNKKDGRDTIDITISRNALTSKLKWQEAGLVHVDAYSTRAVKNLVFGGIMKSHLSMRLVGVFVSGLRILLGIIRSGERLKIVGSSTLKESSVQLARLFNHVIGLVFTGSGIWRRDKRVATRRLLQQGGHISVLPIQTEFLFVQEGKCGEKSCTLFKRQEDVAEVRSRLGGRSILVFDVEREG